MIDDTPDAQQPEKRVHRKTPPATPAVQAWLDGEQAREELGTADEQETAELWSRINTEAENLRKRHTPIHVQSRILSSLPDIPVVRDPEPAPARITPAMMAVGGIIILALGALIGFLIVR